MPFSQTGDIHTEDYWNKHFESFLKPLIEECGNLDVFRSEPLRGDILKQIIADLHDSQIVVADLTDNNPNVFWELGVRQSFKHGTITIVEEGTEIPFDISTKGTLHYYPRNHVKNENFRKKFKEAIKDCLTSPDRPDSVVLEIFPARDVSHLVQPIYHHVLPVYYKQKHRPRVGFVITNLGPIPAKVAVTVRAFLGESDLGLIEAERPYYSGKLVWNINPGLLIRGNFALKEEWIASSEKLRLELQVTVFDINGKPHETLPVCYTFVRDKNYWILEPTSFNELRRFI